MFASGAGAILVKSNVKLRSVWSLAFVSVLSVIHGRGGGCKSGALSNPRKPPPNSYGSRSEPWSHVSGILVCEDLLEGRVAKFR